MYLSQAEMIFILHPLVFGSVSASLCVARVPSKLR